MANTFSGQIVISGFAKLVRQLSTDRIAADTSQATWGSNNFDAFSVTLTDGETTDKAEEFYAAERSILTGANDDLDLAGGLTNGLGETITFTGIKLAYLEVDSPDGTKVLRWGPQNVANGWTGWHGGTAAGNYTTVYTNELHVHRHSTGWAVTAGTGDIMRINNPGAGTVTYRILLVGTK